MRITYIVAEDLSKHPGLKYKIFGQIKRWQEQGHQVYQVLLEDKIILDPNGDIINSEKIFINGNSKNKFSLISKMSNKYKFAIYALQIIKPDLTYSRYLFPAPNVGKIYKNAGKLVFEINSDDRSEYLQKNKFTGIYNAIFRSFSLRNADALVFVTRELSSSESFKFFSKKRIVIANGINISDFEFLPKTNNKTPQLVFIGSPGQAWHGLDKIQLLAKVLKNCTFNIIGPSKKSCIDEWDIIPENVIFHGYLTAEEAKNFIKNMDVGIGTLGLHRNKMYEACPLKVRQYLAQGLPIIAASKDTDILGNKLFYLELPNIENNISDNLEYISDFINKAFNNENLRLEARNFASSQLSFDKKESVRLRFFNEVVSL